MIKATLFLLLISVLLTTTFAQVSSCDGGACEHHGQCNSNEEVCCGGVCVNYYSTERTAQEGESCVCNQCDPTEHLYCNASGVCEKSIYSSHHLNCWCVEDSDCVIGFCYDNACKAPPMAVGERCNVDDECIDTAICRVGKCTTNEQAENAICYNADSNCGEGFQCVFEGKRHCASVKIPVGQNCLTGACVEGAYCDSRTYECTELLEEGDICQISSSCASGLCTGKTTCQVMKQVDEICTSNADCETGRCITKGPVEVCSDLAWTGQSCNFDSDCISNYCGPTNECVELLTDGSNCTDDFECVSGRCFNLICTPIGGIDADCDVNSDCLSNRCNNNLCAAKLADGELCNVNNDCVTDICETSFNDVCLDLLPVGAETNNAADCIYGKRTNGFPRYCADADPNDCFSNLECPANEACDRNSGTCGAPKVQFQECEVDEECDTNLWCRDTQCQPDNFNETCTQDTDCTSANCNLATSRCDLALPDGSFCTSFEQCVNRSCNNNNQCGLDLPVGDSCTFGAQCETGRCDRESTCFALLADGEICNFNNDVCISGFCNSNTNECFTKLVATEECTSDNECISDKCNNQGQCSPYRCGELQCRTNEQCNRNEDCYSGRCEGSFCRVAYREQDDECSVTFECGAGLFCGELPTRRCERRPSVFCNNNNDCAFDEICVVAANTCTKKSGLPISGECDDHSQCQFYCDHLNRRCVDSWKELYSECFDVECGPNSQCKETAICISEDNLANENELCDDKACRNGLTCTSELKCEVVALESVPRGEEVLINRLYCETKMAWNGICVDVDAIALGQLCYDDVECTGETLCFNSECVPIRSLAVDAECIADISCEDGLACVGGVCTDLSAFIDVLAPGDECDELFGQSDDDRLICECAASNLEYSTIPVEDKFARTKEFLLECKESEVPDFDAADVNTLDVAIIREKYEISDACFHSGMRLFCEDFCGAYLSFSVDVTGRLNKKYYAELFNVKGDTVIDCSTGEVTTTTTDCPQLKLSNCDSIGFVSQKVNEYFEDVLNVDSPSGSVLVSTDRPVATSSSVVLFMSSLLVFLAVLF